MKMVQIPLMLHVILHDDDTRTSHLEIARAALQVHRLPVELIQQAPDEELQLCLAAVQLEGMQ